MESSRALRLAQWTRRLCLGSSQPIDLEGCAEKSILWIIVCGCLVLASGYGMI